MGGEKSDFRFLSQKYYCRRLGLKIQKAAANNIIFERVPGTFFQEPADKKKTKNRGKKPEKLLRRTVVPGIRITSRTLWTTTNKLEAGPAAKGRDNEGQMRDSHVRFFGLVATSPAPAHLKLPLLLNLMQIS